MTFRKKSVKIKAELTSTLIELSKKDWNNLPDWFKDQYEDGNAIIQPNQIEIVTLEGTMTAQKEDWVICGVNGEIYPCKPDIFDKTYESVTSDAVDFGEAIRALKDGKRVARKGWDGKNMFLFLLPANDNIPTSAIHDPHLRQVIETEVGGETFNAYGSIRMFTADKKILTGWLASQTDMLSEDWVVLQ